MYVDQRQWCQPLISHWRPKRYVFSRLRVEKEVTLWRGSADGKVTSTSLSHLLSRLQSVMNAAARLIFSSWKFHHITPLLHQLHWLKAPERIAFKHAVLVYKCLHVSAPAYVTDELCQVADIEARRRLRSSSSSSLIVSRTWLSTIGDRAFPVAAARVWNSLPDHVTSAPSVAVFWSRLKTHLFIISYPSPLWLYSACVVTLSCFGHFNRSCLLTYLLTCSRMDRFGYRIHAVYASSAVLGGSAAACQRCFHSSNLALSLSWLSSMNAWYISTAGSREWNTYWLVSIAALQIGVPWPWSSTSCNDLSASGSVIKACSVFCFCTHAATQGISWWVLWSSLMTKD